jgi:cytochrome P450
MNLHIMMTDDWSFNNLLVLFIFSGLIVLVGVQIFSSNIKASDEKQVVMIGEPRGYPLIGSVLDLLPNVFMDSCERFATEYGKIVKINVLGKKMYIISDSNICKEILTKRPKVFRRVKSFDYGAKILNLRCGLFNIHGPEWSRIRKITSPALAKYHVMKKMDTMLTEA